MRIFAKFWEAIGNFWHAHEIVGFDNIPEKGPALLIFYHATVFPVDIYYVYSKIFLQKNRMMKTVVDSFLYKVPGNIIDTLN